MPAVQPRAARPRSGQGCTLASAYLKARPAPDAPQSARHAHDGCGAASVSTMPRQGQGAPQSQRFLEASPLARGPRLRVDEPRVGRPLRGPANLIVASPVDPKLNCSTCGVNGLLHGFAVGSLFGPISALSGNHKVPQGLGSRLGVALMVRESLKAAACCGLGLGSYEMSKCAFYRMREEKDDVWNYIYAGGLSGAAVGGVRERCTATRVSCNENARCLRVRANGWNRTLERALCRRKADTAFSETPGLILLWGHLLCRC
eukprot:scaffold569_cov408-Prasinococcus_capsulatus_cf.AAC.45